jgi:hypothetical protein
MGINGSNYSTSSWVINGAGDGYLYVDQGNLALGTTASNITLFVGPADTTDSIVATFTATSFNVDNIQALNSSTLSLNQGNGSVSMDSLLIPVGTILGSTTATVYTLASLTLTNVVAYSTLTTDALVTGEYGLITGVPAPYAVYEFTQTPEPILQVGDILSGAGIPNILPSGVGGYTGTVVLAVCTGTYSNYVVGYSDYSIVPPPPADIAVLVGRNTQNATLDITTLPITDIALTPGAGGNVIVGRSILPLINDAFDLGSPAMRWRHVWVGAGTIYILDETLGTDTAIGARDGVVYLQGGVGLNVGEFTLKDNQIKIADPNRDILVGSTTATGKVIFNRPITVNTQAGQSTFTVDRLGLTKINPPTSLASTQSALSIVGNASGIQQPRNFSDTMLQITGADNTSTRVSMDSFGTGVYPVIAGRQAGGTVTAPTRTTKDDTLFRISTQGWGDTGYVSAIGRIQVQALQDFTDTTAGTRVRFQVTPVNTTTIQTVSADITATGLSLVGNPIGGVTFRDSTFQITAFTSTNAVTRLTAGTGTYVSTSTGNITVWINGDYATTATVNTLIANSLTNYATQSFVTTQGYTTTATVNTLIANSLTNFVYTGTVKLSVTTASSGTSALSFTTSTGVLTFTPPNLSSYATQNYVTSQGYTTTATVNTLIANSLTNVVKSITAGTGTAVSTSTGAVTIWAVPQAITSTGSTTASNYTIDLSGPTFVHWQPTANGNRTITLTGFTAGRKTEVFITPHQTSDTFTVSGVTARNCSNNSNIFTNHNIGGSQQDSFMLQIYCTTNDISGVWIFGSGSV